MKIEKKHGKSVRGGYEAGVAVNGRSWRWLPMTARCRSDADKKAPKTYALLLEQAADEHDDIARSFTDTAEELRAKAAEFRAGKGLEEEES